MLSMFGFIGHTKYGKLPNIPANIRSNKTKVILESNESLTISILATRKNVSNRKFQIAFYHVKHASFH